MDLRVESITEIDLQAYVDNELAANRRMEVQRACAPRAGSCRRTSSRACSSNRCRRPYSFQRPDKMGVMAVATPRRINQARARSYSLRTTGRVSFDRMIYRTGTPRNAVLLSLEEPSALRRLWRCQAGAIAARSGNERIVLLLIRFDRSARRSRQLKHGRVLAFAQPGEQNDLSIRKFQRVVVRRRLFPIDLPEPS